MALLRRCRRWLCRRQRLSTRQVSNRKPLQVPYLNRNRLPSREKMVQIRRRCPAMNTPSRKQRLKTRRDLWLTAPDPRKTVVPSRFSTNSTSTRYTTRRRTRGNHADSRNRRRQARVAETQPLSSLSQCVRRATICSTESGKSI